MGHFKIYRAIPERSVSNDWRSHLICGVSHFFISGIHSQRIYSCRHHSAFRDWRMWHYVSAGLHHQYADIISVGIGHWISGR